MILFLSSERTGTVNRPAAPAGHALDCRRA
jgi:hypothetical protein